MSWGTATSASPRRPCRTCGSPPAAAASDTDDRRTTPGHARGRPGRSPDALDADAVDQRYTTKALSPADAATVSLPASSAITTLTPLDRSEEHTSELQPLKR